MATNSYRVTCRTCDGTGYVRKWILFKKICVLCFGIGYRTVDYDIKRYRPSPPRPVLGAMPGGQRVEEAKATSRSEEKDNGLDSLALASGLNSPSAPTPELFSAQGGSFGGARGSDSWSESSSDSSRSSSSSDSSSRSS
jgi:hypothetical protein